MGGEPYYYFVKYNADINAALQELRNREFKAGRYNPVFPDLYRLFPIRPDSPAPGPQHESIRNAFESTSADGTRSILDIDHISDEPDFCAAAPLPPEVLERLFGTQQPTTEMIRRNVEETGELFEILERGQCAYIIGYRDGQPDELFFAGYSFD